MEVINVLINGASSIVSLTLLLCAVIAFIRKLFWGDTDNQEWQKIFGALVILTIALISENGWAISIAVIIGGLIVASEDFMKFVAAIYRSDPEKVAETINAFRTSKASDKEVAEKLKEDVKEELIIAPAPEEPVPTTSSENARDRMIKTRKVEGLVHAYLQKEFKNYEPQVKITTKDGSMVVDGVIRRKSGKLGAVIEVRYITPKSFPILKNLIFSFHGKLARIGIKRRILMPVVSDGMTPDAAQKMFEENRTLASLLFFKLSENDQLELIDVKK